MVLAIRCHRQNMKTSIINGSEVSRLSVAIQTLKSAEFNFYRINYSGQEEIYYIITLENVRVVHYSPVMHDTRSVTGTGHMEDISLSYEKITHLYKDGNILHSDSWNEKYGCH
ncbi:type VI secretion system tube protein TssD [Raoultella planticola]